MRKNIVVFFSFAEVAGTGTAGNKRVSRASNLPLGRFIPPWSKSSPTDWRMDSGTPPVWGCTACTHHWLTLQQALFWREERCQYLIYEDSARLCKMVTWCQNTFACVSVWMSMCATGRLAEGRINSTCKRGEKNPARSGLDKNKPPRWRLLSSPKSLTIKSN